MLMECEPAQYWGLVWKVCDTHQAKLRVTGNFHLRLLPEAADSDSLELLLSTSSVALQANRKYFTHLCALQIWHSINPKQLL